MKLNLVIVLYQPLNLQNGLRFDLMLVQQRLSHHCRSRLTLYRWRFQVPLIVVVHRIDIQRLVKFRFRIRRLIVLELLQDILSESRCEITLR